MLRDIIQHQDYSLGWIAPDQQRFQKLDEGIGVFDGRGVPGDGILRPVVPSNEMPLLLGARMGGRHPFLLADLHPARLQRRVKGQGCFIHKDELKVAFETLF